MIDYRTMAERRSDPPSGRVDIDLGSLYLSLLSRWPIMVAGAVAGALLGLVVATLLPARYQAASELFIGIDYSRVELLDEDIEWYLLRRAQDLLLSDHVLQGAVDSLSREADTQLASRTLDEFRENVRLTRIEARWILMVSDSDPSAASAFANAWATSALAAIEDSQQHAWRVAELQGTFFEIACRPDQHGLWICDEAAPESAGNDLSGDLLREIQATNGIAPIISYGLLSKATAPEKPASSSRALLTGSGAALGLIVGLGFVLRATTPYARGRVEAPAIWPERSKSHPPESEQH